MLNFPTPPPPTPLKMSPPRSGGQDGSVTASSASLFRSLKLAASLAPRGSSSTRPARKRKLASAFSTLLSALPIESAFMLGRNITVLRVVTLPALLGLESLGRALPIHNSNWTFNLRTIPVGAPWLKNRPKIPEDIIGIQGTNIEYKQCRAILTVQESRVPDEIIVEIKGISSQFQTAQRLIQEVISNHKEPVTSNYSRLDIGLRSSYSQLGSSSYPSSSLSSQPYCGYGCSGLGGYSTFRL